MTALLVRRDVFDGELRASEFARSLLRTMAMKLREGDVMIKRAIEDLLQLQALKEDLFSLIVHDLRAPLATLKLAAGALKRGAPNREVVDLVGRSTGYMSSLLADVLDVSLLEAQELPLSLRAVRLDELAREAATVLAAPAQSKKIAIDIRSPELEALVDRKLLRRSIGNLLSNAIKYAPKEWVGVWEGGRRGWFFSFP